MHAFNRQVHLPVESYNRPMLRQGSFLFYPNGVNLARLFQVPSGQISEFITRFPAKSLHIPRILTNFAEKLSIGRALVISSFDTTDLLILC